MRYSVSYSRAAPRWGIKQLFYPRAIFGMDRFEKKLKTGFYVPRGQTENSEVFQGPEHFSRNRVVGPTARVAESLRLSEIASLRSSAARVLLRSEIWVVSRV